MKAPDVNFRHRLIHAVAWAALPGVFVGMAVAYPWGMKAGLGVARSLLLGLAAAVLITLLVSVFVLAAAEGAGWMAARMVHPTSVPYRFDHSGAKALIVQGRYDEAVAALESAAQTHPDDPQPLVELARLHRDRLAQPDLALRWFRRARELPALSDGESKVLMREMLELCRKQGDLPRVAPDLARHASRFAGTPESEWAEAELAEAKASLRKAGEPSA